MSPIHGASTETNSLLGALSSKRDSTYSSMSEYSGRTSPTNSCRSSVGDSVGSGVGSPVGGEAQGHLSFGVQYVVTSPESNTGKLVITVLEARGLTGREYLGNACDPYVKVVVWKERRSLRKQKSPPLHVFRTRTVRHTQDPTFNQSFVIEAAKSDLKELVVKLVAMDSDKWASPSTVGEVTQPLRDIKNFAGLEERTTLNYFLAPAKLDLGEVLFGLSYLPTAQRLSVSVIKAQNLKHTNVVDDLKDFCPYIRVLLISGSGRVIKKKKTTWRSNTASPIWNETLIFDLAQSQVEHVTFLLVVCTRPQLPVTPTNSDASLQSTETFHDNSLSLAPPDLNSSSLHDQNQNKKQDRYVGKLALGCNVRSNDQRQHWMAIMASPRKVVSQWHGLK
ncbi:synaptotagmin-1-like [Homarus americanus]|uniref:synaptotagmin-1-like n=1 Tax=Homarus americanus TaxID=6706 RepID=UPI001C490B5D|nr:synaptotagmin-1-like [Homarus americanus]